MKRSLLMSVGAAALFVGLGVGVVLNQVRGPKVTVHADDPSPVGAWWGIARPCPALGDDAAHAQLCQDICGACPNIPGALPPEVPMMPSILGDGNVVVNDAGSIAVFHTTAQGQWAQDSDPTVLQIAGRTRYQASFVWLQGTRGRTGCQGPETSHQPSVRGRCPSAIRYVLRPEDAGRHAGIYPAPLLPDYRCKWNRQRPAEHHDLRVQSLPGAQFPRSFAQRV